MDFKKVSETLAVMIPFLTLCSGIQLVTYYYHWNVSIFDYLSASEVLFLAFEPGLYLVLVASILIAVYFVIVGALLFVFRKFKTEKEDTEKQTPKNASSPMQKRQSVLGVLIVGFACIVIGVFFFQGIWYDFEIFPVVILHIGLLIVPMIVIENFSVTKGQGSTRTSFLIGVIIVLLSASFFHGRYKAHNAQVYPRSQKLILTDGSVVETNENVFYLGKTSGYFFFYNKLENQTSIIPSSQIRTISIRQGD